MVISLINSSLADVEWESTRNRQIANTHLINIQKFKKEKAERKRKTQLTTIEMPPRK